LSLLLSIVVSSFLIRKANVASTMPPKNLDWTPIFLSHNE
jgi:hypothetical protein